MSAALAGLRGSVYEGLALAFRPPSKDFYRSLSCRLLSPLGDLKNLFAWPGLEQSAALGKLTEKKNHALASKTRGSLKLEYERLFVGPYKLPAPPYASLYLESEPTVMGRSTLGVLRMYEDAGFVLSPSFKDLPDHIAAELEFMALVCEEERRSWKKGDPSGAGRFLSVEERFLSGHLVQWIPKFTAAILFSTQTPFYRALASLTRDYVVLDLNSVQAARRLLNAEPSPMP